MNREDVIREIEESYRQSGRSLNEFQRRLWAATEAIKLGRGGISIVSKALRISPNTIKRGIQEIATGQAELLLDANARIRKPGGGRKPSSERSRQLKSNMDSAGTESAPRTSDCLDENRHGFSPSATDEESFPVIDDAPAYRPNQHE